ncbi:MAG: small multi-drug export protein, partial [Planctomycetota bacterium]
FFSPWELSFLVLYMDLMVALLVVYHIGFLFKLPWLGRRLALLAMQSRRGIARHRWIRRITFLVTVAFVMFPLASTGSVGGGILARLCGISRTGALMAIVLGSILGCAAMFAGAELIRRYLDPTSPATIGAGIAVIVVVILVLNWLYRRAVRATGPAA